jgi:DNA mismatch endonuclease (patch repair protein)
MVLRRGLHALGFRYRIHDRTLPGSPDIVFAGRKAVIFVHGCFWHKHDCHLFRIPSTRPEFWTAKIAGNVARDQAAIAALVSGGWRVATVWECALKGKTRIGAERVLQSCAEWLESGTGQIEIRGNEWPECSGVISPTILKE